MTEEFEYDPGDGLYEGFCVACALPGLRDPSGLCESCSGMLDRDLSRSRDWAYTSLALSTSEADRERVRKLVIARHGKAMELLCEPAPERSAKRRRKRRRRR